MVDVKMENGDIVTDSSGKAVKITGIDALFQRAMICINTRLGSFIYDRELGSYKNEVIPYTENAAQRAELVINEALAKYENTSAKIVEYGEKIKLIITIGNESRTEEVRFNGYLQ